MRAKKNPQPNTFKQIFVFFIIGQIALLSQILCRIILDLSLKNLTTVISIKPFEDQALGSFIAFSLSNIIGKALSYILNLKKNFKASNTTHGIIIYVVMQLTFIIVEAIIGTPLQNSYYVLFKGSWTGAISTLTVQNHTLYQICGTLSIITCGLVDSTICFVMDKYVIMKKTVQKE